NPSFSTYRISTYLHDLIYALRYEPLNPYTHAYLFPALQTSHTPLIYPFIHLLDLLLFFGLLSCPIKFLIRIHPLLNFLYISIPLLFHLPYLFPYIFLFLFYDLYFILFLYNIIIIHSYSFLYPLSFILPYNECTMLYSSFCSISYTIQKIFQSKKEGLIKAPLSVTLFLFCYPIIPAIRNSKSV